MSRSSVSQPQRTQNTPLSLGTFSQTSLRYLKGTLGPQWKVVGRADTNQTSNGGIGGGGGRDGTAMADSEIHLLVLGKKDLTSILEEFDDLGLEIKQIAKERKTYHEELIMKIDTDYKNISSPNKQS
jgi:hypothetical protein